MRPAGDEYYLGIAKAVSEASTCVWTKRGAVIVSNDGELISTGYTHDINDIINCRRDKFCSWQKTNGTLPVVGLQGQCDVLQAEVFAFFSADKTKLRDSTLYIYEYDCVHNHTRTTIPDPVTSKIAQHLGVKRICCADGEEYDILDEYRDTEEDVKDLVKGLLREDE